MLNDIGHCQMRTGARTWRTKTAFTMHGLVGLGAPGWTGARAGGRDAGERRLRINVKDDIFLERTCKVMPERV